MNDQFFQRGDKVMRVADIRPPRCQVIDSEEHAEYGVIYVVSEFWIGFSYNFIDLIGFSPTYDDGFRVGFLAMDFRKVEEIKLCVEAAKHAKKPEKALA